MQHLYVLRGDIIVLISAWMWLQGAEHFPKAEPTSKWSDKYMSVNNDVGNL